jgi:hypothetical protein
MKEERRKKKLSLDFFFFLHEAELRERERFFLIKFNVFLAFAVNFNLTHLACWFRGETMGPSARRVLLRAKFVSLS